MGYCDFQSSWDKKADAVRRMAVPKRGFGVCESTYWEAKTRLGGWRKHLLGCENALRIAKALFGKVSKTHKTQKQPQNAKKQKVKAITRNQSRIVHWWLPHNSPSHSRFANTGGGSHLAYSANGLQHLVSFIGRKPRQSDDVQGRCAVAMLLWGALQGTARDMRLREWTCRQCAAFWDRGVFGSPCAVFRARLK